MSRSSTRGGIGGWVSFRKPGCIMADGVDAVIHAVRRVIASGADWVKVYGSTGGFDDVTGFQTFTYEEVKAAVDVTHALGEKIAIHCYGPACARDAARAGVDSLEHATDMDDQTIAEMVKKKIYYVAGLQTTRCALIFRRMKMGEDL